MSPTGKLLAWIEPRADHEFLAVFVGGDAAGPHRAPATQPCPTSEEARQWIEAQAAEVDLPVEWLQGAPGR